jgi:hypothetical protein
MNGYPMPPVMDKTTADQPAYPNLQQTITQSSLLPTPIGTDLNFGISNPIAIVTATPYQHDISMQQAYVSTSAPESAVSTSTPMQSYQNEIALQQSYGATSAPEVAVNTAIANFVGSEAVASLVVDAVTKAVRNAVGNSIDGQDKPQYQTTAATQLQNMHTMQQPMFNNLFEPQNAPTPLQPLQPMLAVDSYNIFERNAISPLPNQQSSLFIDQDAFSQPMPPMQTSSSLQNQQSSMFNEQDAFSQSITPNHLVDMLLQPAESQLYPAVSQASTQHLVDMMLQPAEMLLNVAVPHPIQTTSQQFVEMMMQPNDRLPNQAVQTNHRSSPLPSPMGSNPLITSLINSAGSASPLISPVDSHFSDGMEHNSDLQEAYGSGTPTLMELESEITPGSFDSTSSSTNTESFERSVSALSTICRYV